MRGRGRGAARGRAAVVRPLVAWAGLLVALVACDGRITPPDEPTLLSLDAELRQSLERWGAMPVGAMPPQDPARVALGRALFFDRELSGNRDVSCATCHQPAEALGDGMSLGVGTGATGTGRERRPGQGRDFLPRTSPSLLNSGVGLRYHFWDGRLASFGHVLPAGSVPLPTELTHGLEMQAMLPVLDRREMRGEPGDTDVFGDPNELANIPDGDPQAIWRAVMDRLLAIPAYAELFGAAFPDAPVGRLRFEHAARALAAFQKEAFTTTRSPFDSYLERDDGALTAAQKRGGLLFFERAGCQMCHGGALLGGQTFANVGAPQIGPGGSREPPLDLGRGEVQDFDFYRFAFRVPPLRNVELTAPYMHSGAYPTLEAVVRHYNDIADALRSYDPSHLDPALRSLYHGDEATVGKVLETLDFRVREPLGLDDDEIADLVAFLRSLTDPSARDLGDAAPAEVPSGLPVDR